MIFILLLILIMLVYKKTNIYHYDRYHYDRYKIEKFQNDRLFKQFQKNIFICKNKKCVDQNTIKCLNYCDNYKLNQLCPLICIKNNKYMNDNINWNSYMFGDTYKDNNENR